MEGRRRPDWSLMRWNVSYAAKCHAAKPNASPRARHTTRVSTTSGASAATGAPAGGTSRALPRLVVTVEKHAPLSSIHAGPGGGARAPDVARVAAREPHDAGLVRARPELEGAAR